MEVSNAHDFFVSYTKADESWAEWIGWELESQGYNVLFQKWDFHAADHFQAKIRDGLQASKRLIAVLSSDYLTSKFCQQEYDAALVRDPNGKNGVLVPVRVRECELP